MGGGLAGLFRLPLTLTLSPQCGARGRVCGNRPPHQPLCVPRGQRHIPSPRPAGRRWRQPDEGLCRRCVNVSNNSSKSAGATEQGQIALNALREKQMVARINKISIAIAASPRTHGRSDVVHTSLPPFSNHSAGRSDALRPG